MVLAETSVEETYRPRYREIEQAIRQRLARLKPGADLPSDAQLCEEFGVSRMTARHAMNRLAQEGLVVRAGCLPTRGRATISAEPAAADDARWLQMRKGDPMLVERRIILDQQGRPLEFTESRYPADRYALDVDFVVERQGTKVVRRDG